MKSPEGVAELRRGRFHNEDAAEGIFSRSEQMFILQKARYNRVIFENHRDDKVRVVPVGHLF
ncbi:MAG: hypothetical protein KJ950_04215 [Proteobacteria bacterium]|nr:hypothetical protein [Pseudomonadota bacterium]MBU1688470.1 hypothetical protein [Pseudomonadota bacterium]